MMNRKKMEKNIINSIDKEKVLSVEDIKSRMDFSKKELIKKEDNKVLFSKKKLVFTSLVSSFATLIIVLVVSFAIRGVHKSNKLDDILSKDELCYIKDNSVWINPEPVFFTQVFSFDTLYIIETYDLLDDDKVVYYYKYLSDDEIINSDLIIDGKIIKITQDKSFGILCEKLKNIINSLEFTVKSENGERYYCFTN